MCLILLPFLTDLSGECLTSFALKNYGPQTFNKNKACFIAPNNIRIRYTSNARKMTNKDIANVTGLEVRV